MGAKKVDGYDRPAIMRHCLSWTVHVMNIILFRLNLQTSESHFPRLIFNQTISIIPSSIMASMLVFHTEDPGSIPGLGTISFFLHPN